MKVLKMAVEINPTAQSMYYPVEEIDWQSAHLETHLKYVLFYQSCERVQNWTASIVER